MYLEVVFLLLSLQILCWSSLFPRYRNWDYVFDKKKWGRL